MPVIKLDPKGGRNAASGQNPITQNPNLPSGGGGDENSFWSAYAVGVAIAAIFIFATIFAEISWVFIGISTLVAIVAPLVSRKLIDETVSIWTLIISLGVAGLVLALKVYPPFSPSSEDYEVVVLLFYVISWGVVAISPFVIVMPFYTKKSYNKASYYLIGFFVITFLFGILSNLRGRIEKTGIDEADDRIERAVQMEKWGNNPQVRFDEKTAATEVSRSDNKYLFPGNGFHDTYDCTHPEFLEVANLEFKVPAPRVGVMTAILECVQATYYSANKNYLEYGKHYKLESVEALTSLLLNPKTEEEISISILAKELLDIFEEVNEPESQEAPTTESAPATPTPQTQSSKPATPTAAGTKPAVKKTSKPVVPVESEAEKLRKKRNAERKKRRRSGG